MAPALAIDSLPQASLVQTADLNNDGWEDVVVASGFSPIIQWYENTGGAFGAGTFVATTGGLSIGAILTGDVNSDGNVDIVVGLAVNSPVQDRKIMWYNNTDGMGSFGPSILINVGDTQIVSGLALADLNGDKTPDLVSSTSANNRVTWFSNLYGNGTFGPPEAIMIDTNPFRDLTVGDLTGDHTPDVVAAQGDRILWFNNTDGLASFATGLEIASGISTITSVILGDIDGDGDQDVAVGNAHDEVVGMVTWFENIDNATSFAPTPLFTTSAQGTQQVLLADLDGDGDLDLASLSTLDSSKVAWYENTDGAGFFSAQIVIALTPPPPPFPDPAIAFTNFAATDVDKDGDIDFVATQSVDNRLDWFENAQVVPSFAPSESGVSTVPESPRSAIAIDLDSDGDLDIVYASAGDNSISWQENTDGAGLFGPRIVITDLAGGASAVIAADFDLDGDWDLAAACDSGKYTWYENTNGAGAFGPEIIIKSNEGGASTLAAGDVDGDGDDDIVGGTTTNNRIVLFFNTDGQGSFGPRVTIDGNSLTSGGPRSVILADLDGDGDLDVAAAFFNVNRLAWYENTDGTGSFGSQNIVVTGTGPFDGGTTTFAADLDGDSDLDLLAGAFDENRIAWHRNNGAGSFSSQIIISSNGAPQVRSVIAADLDGDGDNDVASASYAPANSGIF